MSGKIGFELPKIPNTWLSDDAQATAVIAAGNSQQTIGGSQGLMAVTGNSGGNNFSLGERVKPKLNSMPQGSVTKTLTQNRTEQRTINYGGLAFYGYDKHEIKQELRNKEQLAAG
ncbi:hypothetical protein [Haemophilus influenzae]|uniref:hypothetical protein n=1 Tax=Haemophilus influenzae TaxID=727 RepID=UPI001CB9B1F7|nr:hypothetical protein [Haemophilus influenzae]